MLTKSLKFLVALPLAPFFALPWLYYGCQTSREYWRWVFTLTFVTDVWEAYREQS